MQSELHGNVVYHGVELLLLVSMLFPLAIPKSFSILKEFLYTLDLAAHPSLTHCFWSSPQTRDDDMAAACDFATM